MSKKQALICDFFRKRPVISVVPVNTWSADQLPPGALLDILSHLNKIDVDTLLFAAPHVNHRWRNTCAQFRAKLKWDKSEYSTLEVITFTLKHFPETVALSLSNFVYFVEDKKDKAEGTPLFDFIKPCANLKHLELQHPYGVMDEDMMLLAKHCTNLTSISMILNPDYDVHEIDNTVRTLGQLTQLRSIQIRSQSNRMIMMIEEDEDRSMSIFDGTISQALAKCTQLTHIDLCNSCVGMEGVKALAMNCTMLTSVDLGVFCNPFQDDFAGGAAYFGIHCPHLTAIDLSGTGVVDEDIIKLVDGCPNLKAIDLSATEHLTDVSVKRITYCHYLEWIGLDLCTKVSCTAIQLLQRSLLNALVDHGCAGCEECGYGKEFESIEATLLSTAWEENTVRKRQYQLLEELKN